MMSTHTLHAGVQDAVAEVLALQDFLDDVVGVHPSGVHSPQLVLHRVLLHWGSERDPEVIPSVSHVSILVETFNNLV